MGSYQYLSSLKKWQKETGLKLMVKSDTIELPIELIDWLILVNLNRDDIEEMFFSSLFSLISGDFVKRKIIEYFLDNQTKYLSLYNKVNLGIFHEKLFNLVLQNKGYLECYNAFKNLIHEIPDMKLNGLIKRILSMDDFNSIDELFYTLANHTNENHSLTHKTLLDYFLQNTLTYYNCLYLAKMLAMHSESRLQEWLNNYIVKKDENIIGILSAMKYLKGQVIVDESHRFI